MAKLPGIKCPSLCLVNRIGILALSIILSANLNAQDTLQGKCLIELDYTASNITCKGGDDGAIDLEIKNTNSPIIKWSNGESSEDINMLTAGEYSVSVSENECVKTLSILISEPETNLFLQIEEKEDISCVGLSDGIVKLSASGGTEPYEFANEGLTDFQADQVYSALASGEYNFLVRDINKCTASAKTSISETPTALIDLGNNISIQSGEEIIFDAGTDYSEYLWSTGENSNSITFIRNVSTVSKESISVDVVDENGCALASNIIEITILPVENGTPEVLDEDL